MADPDELTEGQLASVLDSLAQPLIVLSRDGLVLHTNDAADDHFPVMEGDPWVPTLPVAERAAGEAALARARDNEVSQFEFERDQRTWQITVQPSHVGLVVSAQERTASAGENRRLAAERMHMNDVMSEMEHRVGNLLSMVPAIVKLSLRKVDDVREARETVVSRVSALAAAHSAMLTPEAIEEGVSLDAMIGAVLHTHGDDRFVTSGPPVHLATRGSNAVALALHELAANAAKFGALSRPDGKVRLAWAIEASARDVKLPAGAQSVLRLLWSETGGPAIAGAPTKRGFGVDVIDRLILSQGGAIEREWLQHGLNVTIDLPLYELGHEPKFGGDMRPAARSVGTLASDEAATRIVERAVASVGGASDLEPSGNTRPPAQRSGPSETEILLQLERIITRN